MKKDKGKSNCKNKRRITKKTAIRAARKRKTKAIRKTKITK